MTTGHSFLTNLAVKTILAKEPPSPKQRGPQDCCADFARVIACDDVNDRWECPFCGYSWDAPCR